MRSAGEERSTGEGTKRCLTVVALRGRIMVLIKSLPVLQAEACWTASV